MKCMNWTEFNWSINDDDDKNDEFEWKEEAKMKKQIKVENTKDAKERASFIIITNIHWDQERTKRDDEDKEKKLEKTHCQFTKLTRNGTNSINIFDKCQLNGKKQRKKEEEEEWKIKSDRTINTQLVCNIYL